MKKIIALLLLLVLVISCVSCTDKNEGSGTNNPSTGGGNDVGISKTYRAF